MIFASKLFSLLQIVSNIDQYLFFLESAQKHHRKMKKNRSPKNSILNEKAWTIVRLLCPKNGNELDDIYNAFATSITQW